MRCRFIALNWFRVAGAAVACVLTAAAVVAAEGADGAVADWQRSTAASAT